jgi:GNAT superfamily N-acetyltransferase
VIEQSVIYRAMKAGDEQQVCDLVVRVFTDFVAPLYSQDGVREFLSYAADPSHLCNRLLSDHFVLLAELHGRIVGAVEIRTCDHISLFFIDGEVQRQGIGRELWRRALDACLSSRPDVAGITVNSSPNAADAYRRMGFHAEGPEQTVNGIRFVPMVFAVTDIADI